MNDIPLMTEPLGKYWKQPDDICDAEMDGTHVLLSDAQFQKLHEYSTTLPSGVYPGKCWKRYQGEWLLVWYGEIPGDAMNCSIHARKILRS